MTQEALKLALEALEKNNNDWKRLADSGDAGWWTAEETELYKQTEQAITAIKEALAQPESDYERGFIDGMQKQMQSSVDKAVNRMTQPEQEPVAWWNDTGTHIDLNVSGRGTPLYTHPVKDLEDININITWNENSMRDFGKDELNFARAILRKAQEKLVNHKQGDKND